MSKCREAFEAECERLCLRTEKHWYDCGSRMKYVYPEEMYPLFKAAWNARGTVDAEISQGRIGGAVQDNEWWRGFRTAMKQIAEVIKREDERG